LTVDKVLSSANFSLSYACTFTPNQFIGLLMHKSTPLLILLVLLLLTSKVDSQTNGTLGKRFFSNWSVSASGGPNIFYGDLKRYKFWPATTPVNEIRYAGTFSLNRQLSHVFMLRAQVLYGEIAGEKLHYKDGSPCNQYFEGNILEYNLNTTIDFTNLFFGYRPGRFFFVYGTIGAGLSNWITVKRDLITHEQIGGSGSPSNWTTEIVVPAGIGAYFSIKDKVNLGLEWTYRAVNSNKLDATEGRLPYEAYSLFAFNITYNFNKHVSDKLTNASPQKQIGPPPPQPLLASEIAAEKQKEKAAKEQSAYPKLPPPPLALKDTSRPMQTILIPDTAIKEELLPDTNISVVPVKGISYRVQVFAFRENTYSAEQVKDKFKLSHTVMKEYSGGWFRYTIGSFTNLTEAKKLMTELRTKKEIPDAFIAKYVNGKRATPAPPKTIKHSRYTKGKVYYSKPKHKK